MQYDPTMMSWRYQYFEGVQTVIIAACVAAWHASPRQLRAKGIPSFSDIYAHPIMMSVKRLYVVCHYATSLTHHYGLVTPTPQRGVVRCPIVKGTTILENMCGMPPRQPL